MNKFFVCVGDRDAVYSNKVYLYNVECSATEDELLKIEKTIELIFGYPFKEFLRGKRTLDLEIQTLISEMGYKFAEMIKARALYNFTSPTEIVNLYKFLILKINPKIDINFELVDTSKLIYLGGSHL